MVYVFECVYSDRNKEKLETLRKDIMKQIFEGVVLLPSEVRLKEVVKTDAGLDVVLTGPKGGKLNV
jgi:hypothetical protein